MMVRQILNSGRGIPLSRLFALRDYPREVGSLYAEGYSVTNFLVATAGRKTFLDFVAHGTQYGWDSAAQTYYRYRTVNELQQAWINYLQSTRRQPPSAELAHNTGGNPYTPANRVVVRLTAPPIQPLQEAAKPVVRGQAPEDEQAAGWHDLPRRERDGYLPDFNPGLPAAARPQPLQDNWQPPTVRLGRPQFDPAPAGNPPQQDARPVSPIGYPH